MDDIQKDLLPIFLQEAQDKLPVISAFMKERDAHGCSMTALNTVFRAIHSLKGTAGMVRADSVRQIALRIEKILERHLLQKTSPTAVEQDAIDLALDKMTSLIDCLATSCPEPGQLLQVAMRALDLAEAFPGHPETATGQGGAGTIDPFADDEDLDSPGISTRERFPSPSCPAATGLADSALPEDPFAEVLFEISASASGRGNVGRETGFSVREDSDPFAEDPDFEPVAP